MTSFICVFIQHGGASKYIDKLPGGLCRVYVMLQCNKRTADFLRPEVWPEVYTVVCVQSCLHHEDYLMLLW